MPQESVDEENLKDQGFKFEFTDDGHLVTKIANLYNITEKTYLLSANDNLYTVTSLFASTNELPDNVDSLYKLDNKGFNKLSKQMVNSLKFTEPQKNGNKQLTINDNISGRKLQLPENGCIQELISAVFTVLIKVALGLLLTALYRKLHLMLQITQLKPLVLVLITAQIP